MLDLLYMVCAEPLLIERWQFRLAVIVFLSGIGFNIWSVRRVIIKDNRKKTEKDIMQKTDIEYLKKDLQHKAESSDVKIIENQLSLQDELIQKLSNQLDTIHDSQDNFINRVENKINPLVSKSMVLISQYATTKEKLANIEKQINAHNELHLNMNI